MEPKPTKSDSIMRSLSPNTIREIAKVNSLDMALHRYAIRLFSERFESEMGYEVTQMPVPPYYSDDERINYETQQRFGDHANERLQEHEVDEIEQALTKDEMRLDEKDEIEEQAELTENLDDFDENNDNQGEDIGDKDKDTQTDRRDNTGHVGITVKPTKQEQEVVKLSKKIVSNDLKPKKKPNSENSENVDLSRLWSGRLRSNQKLDSSHGNDPAWNFLKQIEQIQSKRHKRDVSENISSRLLSKSKTRAHSKQTSKKPKKDHTNILRQNSKYY